MASPSTKQRIHNQHPIASHCFPSSSKSRLPKAYSPYPPFSINLVKIEIRKHFPPSLPHPKKTPKSLTLIQVLFNSTLVSVSPCSTSFLSSSMAKFVFHSLVAEILLRKTTTTTLPSSFWLFLYSICKIPIAIAVYHKAPTHPFLPPNHFSWSRKQNKTKNTSLTWQALIKNCLFVKKKNQAGITQPWRWWEVWPGKRVAASY